MTKVAMTFERATINDLTDIVHVLVNMNREDAEAHDRSLAYTPYEVENMMQNLWMVLADPDMGAVYIYRKGEDIVGLVSGFLNGNKGYISDIWVHPLVRGGIITSRLFLTMLGYLRQKGADSVSGFVARKNKSVRKALRNQGFREVAIKYTKEF